MYGRVPCGDRSDLTLQVSDNGQIKELPAVFLREDRVGAEKGDLARVIVVA